MAELKVIRLTGDYTGILVHLLHTRMAPMADLSTGTVTFLFTDIAGSTALWQEYPQVMPATLTRHDALLHEAVERHGGHVFKTMGDGVNAAFAIAHDALQAALIAQLAHAGPGLGHLWPSLGPYGTPHRCSGGARRRL